MCLSLLGLTLMRLLLLLEKVFAKIHYPAHGWFGVRGNFHKIQFSFLSQFNGRITAHYSGLFPLIVDYPYVRRLNFQVPSNPLFRSDILFLHNNTAAAREFGLQSLNEVVDCPTAQILATPRAHGHRLCFLLPVAHDQEIRNTL